MSYFHPRRASLILFALFSLALAHSAAAGPKNTTVLLIRHAEKSPDGVGLTPAGEERAKAYVKYFKHYEVDGKPLKISAIFAAADSKKSHRPRITVEPTAAALGLKLDTRFKNDDFGAMVADVDAHHDNEGVLVCWHHGEMPEVLRAFGADPATLLPEGKWASEQYAWLIELRYDAEGKLQSARRVEEGF